MKGDSENLSWNAARSQERIGTRGWDVPGNLSCPLFLGPCPFSPLLFDFRCNYFPIRRTDNGCQQQLWTPKLSLGIPFLKPNFKFPKKVIIGPAC